MKKAVGEIRIDRSFAELLPEADLTGLVEDVRENGVVVPLLLTQDDLLVDGHRRLQAAKAAGLTVVPVNRLDVSGAGSWQESLAMALNLHRRHLNGAQRATLASSLLRIERGRAKERQREGQELGRSNRTEGVLGTTSPEPNRATEKAARAVGVSRKTLERVERIKRESPQIAHRMFEGDLSIASAFKKIQLAELKRRSNECSPAQGRVLDLDQVLGRYRCVYLDPPWEYRDNDGRGAAERKYPTLSTDEIGRLPVPRLLHEEGGHVWLWTTWPMIRDGEPHRLLKAWNLAWKGELVWDSEVVWDKQRLGTGSWVRSRLEVLILAVTKGTPLLSECVDPLISVKRSEEHSEKPPLFRTLLEEYSPGPRIELFARETAEGWDRWGNEA